MVPITLESLGKQFGAVVAVDGVDLRIAAGERLFLLGPSGCGKTTLLRMIAGFTVPTRGRIFLGDQDVTDLPAERRQTGMVFQGYALWPHMTVWQNVAFGLQVRKVSAAEQRRRVEAMLSAVGLADLADRRPGALSGGQQQRVALARALVIEPRVLLLDEPLANLDAALRVELRGQILALCARTGTTTVYVTHDQSEAMAMADRIGVLRDGRLLQAGSPTDLYHRPKSRFVAEFLGKTNIFEATIQGREAGGWRLRSALGPLLSAVVVEAGDWAEGAAARVSIRSEAFARVGARVGEGADAQRVRVRCVEATFLGAMVEHRCEVEGGRPLHVTLPWRQRMAVDEQAALTVDPRDVVLLRDDA
jgi:iron(III) transport system ATP-binding protein